MKESKTNKPVLITSITIVMFAIIFALITINEYRSVFNGKYSDSHEAWGTFGDFIGGTLNPAFSFLSLLAILGALYMQSRELSHSTKALREQSNHLETQAFESTFFSLINLNNENIKSLELNETEDYSTTGRDVFRIMIKRLDQTYNRIKTEKNTDELKNIKNSYASFYSKNQKIKKLLATTSEPQTKY